MPVTKCWARRKRRRRSRKEGKKSKRYHERRKRAKTEGRKRFVRHVNRKASSSSFLCIVSTFKLLHIKHHYIRNERRNERGEKLEKK